MKGGLTIPVKVTDVLVVMFSVTEMFCRRTSEPCGVDIIIKLCCIRGSHSDGYEE
jgi:hypothetical protein